jgi:hypothetical protein
MAWTGVVSEDGEMWANLKTVRGEGWRCTSSGRMLPNQHKALSSNLSTAKIKKWQKTVRRENW